MQRRISPAFLALTLTAGAGCGGSSEPPRAVKAPVAAETRAKRPRAAPRAKPALPPLPPADVVRAMRTNERKLRMCFFQAPLASGFVRLGWDVTPQGEVDRIAVEQSTIDEPEVEKCLASRVSELRFDQQNRSAKGQWTYVFRLASPEEEPSKKKKKKKRPKNDAANTKIGVILETTSPGQIDTDRVDQVVQAAYPLFARCYRDAIARDSGLEGWVGLRFVIDRTGRVSRVLDGESDLEDPMALDCIAESFYALQFPKPRGGNAHVLYRMRLN